MRDLTRPGPLSGMRIVDFTWGKAGPTATALLADLGATVLKIESPARPDGSRGLPPRVPAPPSPGRPFSLEHSGYYNNTNRNKFGLTLDMKSEAGRSTVKRLVAEADGVIASFSAGVLESWGLGYEALREVNPRIVLVSMPGFGHSGPYRDYKTIGPTVQAFCGLTAIAGLPGREPSGWGYSYMDNTGGYMGALAMLTALVARGRTGRGQFVDLAQTEAGTTLTGTAVLDYTVNGRPSAPRGNRCGHAQAAPSGVYPCAGEDRWIAICAHGDDDWRALYDVLDQSALAADPRFDTAATRRKHAEALDALLADATRPHDRYALMDALQRRGVRAGVVQTGVDLADCDPQLAARGFFPEAPHSALGVRRFEGLPVRFQRTPGRIDRGAPLLGEDTAEVLRELLGMDDTAIAAASGREAADA